MNCTQTTKIILYFIAILVLIFLFKNFNKKKNLSTAIIIILISAVILYFAIDFVCKKRNNLSEGFTDNIWDNARPVDQSQSIGPFDNLVFEPKGKSCWRKPPSDLQLYNRIGLYTPQGTPLPLKQQARVTLLPQDSNGPTVDGTKNTPKNMFMFAYNQCRPECCPSTFSCDHGCVCTDEQQRHFINSRGTPNIDSRPYPGI